MTDYSVERSFEAATHGSDKTELLCHAVLEITADRLIGENFVDSEVAAVTDTKEFTYFDNTSVEVAFHARKTVEKENGKPTVWYNPSLTFTRQRLPSEWWPDLDDLLEAGYVGIYDEADDDIDFDYDDEHDGPVVFDFETDEQIPTDYSDDEAWDNCFVNEVWDFYLEDETYKPNMQVRREYYYNDTLLCIESVCNPEAADLMISEDMEEEIDLQLRDSLFSQMFSEIDMEMIEAICDADFQKIRVILEKIGCWAEFTAPEYCEDEL